MSLWDGLIGGGIAAAVIAAVAAMVRDRKRGKNRCGGCDGDCAHCAARRRPPVQKKESCG